MNKHILAAVSLMLLLTVPTYANVTNCYFVSVPQITCDGTEHSATITMPKFAPSPTPIISTFVQLHTGVTPINEIGGLTDVVVFKLKRTQTVPLLAMMNRHGAARWVHNPPIMLNPGDTLEVAYGCQTPAGLSAGIMPDVGVCWKE